MSDDTENLEDVLDRLEHTAEGPEPGAPPAPVLSPTLAMLEASRRPKPMPVCGACPNSMWFASGQGLKCYCRLMHVVTWESEDQKPITACDGILAGL